MADEEDAASGDLLSVKQAAREFGIGKRTLFRMLEHGKLTRYEIPYRRGTFVSRRQLAEVMTPRRRAQRDPSTPPRDRDQQ